MASSTGAGYNGFNGDNWHNLRNNPISNFILGSPAPQQPGTAGPLDYRNYAKVAGTTSFQQDPVTGYYYDAANGQIYADPAGQQPITNPNVAQQVARNIQNASAFMGQLKGLEDQRQQTFGQQQALAKTFQDVISGKAPSPAAIQAQLNANDAARTQLAAAAGSSGASSPLASLMAARNTGQAQIQANNQGVLGRTIEENNASNSLNSLYNAMNNSTADAAKRTADIGLEYTKLAEQGQEANQGFNQKTDEKNSAQSFDFGGGAIKAIGALLA